jgi:tetratricopeptide (TPR) repeat protein
MPSPTRNRVFISYSHDSPQHQQRVLALANRLRSDGVEAWIDQYAPDPDEGWPKWMRTQVKEADKVLLVFTEIYQRRFEGDEEEGRGLGATFEGVIVTQTLYESGGRNAKFRPVVFSEEDELSIPLELRRFNRYRVDTEDHYQNLLRWLHGAPRIVAPTIGQKPDLPVEQASELFPGSISKDKKPIHNLLFPPNPTFTGRDAELKNLSEQLQKGGAVAITQTIAVHGLGGVGKTQLAVEYAWKHLGDYDAVLWVTADSPNALDTSLAGLAGVLGLPEASAKEQNVQIDAVLGWLHGHERWLLIADNADTELAARAVRDRLSPNLRGTILVTSRLGHWPVTMPNLPLDFLLPEDAADFLLDRLAKEGQHAGNKIAALKLAKELGCLPLALEQAAAFIIELRWSFDQYLQYFANARSELLNYRVEGGTRYPASVAKTWSITLERLSPLARSLLRIAAWLVPDDIPRSIFRADHCVLSEALDENVTISDLAVDKALGELARFSLIHLTPETVSVHRLLQAVEQDSLKGDERKKWMEWALRSLNIIAALHVDMNRFDEAAAAIVKATETEREALPPDSALRVPGLSDRGVLLWRIGKYAEAEVACREALALAEQHYGERYPEVSTMRSNLGLLLHDVGRFHEAEECFRRALAIDESLHGSSHLRVAIACLNLGVALKNRGELGEAFRLSQRALNIQTEKLGPDHPDLASTWNNLARLLQLDGQLNFARAALRRAMTIDRKAFGRRHPRLGTRLNNLAHIYWQEGRLDRAERLYRGAIAADRAVHGPSHPGIAVDLYNYAELLRALDREKEADARHAEATDIASRFLPADQQSADPRLRDIVERWQAIEQAIKLLDQEDEKLRQSVAQSKKNIE